MDRATCAGFLAGGVAAGLKKNGKKDLGLIFSQVPAAVAGVFTRNRVQAAPVVLDRQRVRSGVCRAVIANSGGANCCTGEQGMLDAVAMAEQVAGHLSVLGEQVLVASTGVIGQRLPMDKIRAGIPGLVKALSPDGFDDFAQAIMTTDTVPKLHVCNASIHGKPFTIGVTAKGAGMIRPDMATMLCFVCTDVRAVPGALQQALVSAVDRSFNRMTIDGDTSTNDTVLLLANGRSGADLADPSERKYFQEVLDSALMDVARQLVRDGEGVTKLVEIRVQGAATGTAARKVADTVANSNLVKTAFFGEDANWGRILGAAGRAGVDLTPERIDVYFDEVRMVEMGMGCGDQAEVEATQVLKKPEFTVTIDLNMGQEAASTLTCDFSMDYVKINADYRS